MKLPRKLPRDHRDLAEAAKAAGWLIERDGRGHLKWVSPGGEVVRTAATPSDARAVRNNRAALRRAGLIV